MRSFDLKSLVFCFIALTHLTYANPQDSAASKTQPINPYKLGIVLGSVGAGMAASYILVLEKGWWGENGSDFQFENDFYYASNLDKFAHFYGGILIASALDDGLQWSGVNEETSVWTAAGLSTALQIAIDYKDAFAPEYGFSVWDVGAGTLGALIPVIQYYYPQSKHIDLKFSYYKNDQYFWGSSSDQGAEAYVNDYINQTYWMGYTMYQHNLPLWPDFIQPALGLSITRNGMNVENVKPNPKYELYLSLDWNLSQLFKPESKAAKRWLYYLDRVKFPSPTVQFYPHWEMLWAYPIRF